MFDFKKHLIKVQGGRQYLPVAARLLWFREDHPDWAIVTEAVTIDVERQFAIFKATVFDASGKITRQLAVFPCLVVCRDLAFNF